MSLWIGRAALKITRNKKEALLQRRFFQSRWKVHELQVPRGSRSHAKGDHDVGAGDDCNMISRIGKPTAH